MILLTSRVKTLAIFAGLALLVGTAGWAFFQSYKPPQPIRIGVLHSLTGTLAVSERPLVDAVQMAVTEINARGGVLGRPLEMVVADGQSDPAVFAREAERLITQEKVSVLFGCWTSASRKTVKPVVETHRHLLFYPVQYEGLEQSPNIIYTGSAPNQQIIPGTHWALENLGKRVYLLGSDYVFPRTANRIIRDIVQAAGGQVLGERYLPFDSSIDLATGVAEIRRLKPDVIINTINGDNNFDFFQALQTTEAKNIPILSFSVSESELTNHPELSFNAHYAAWSYFQSIATANNRRFVADFKRLFGEHRATSDTIEAAYVGVYLWAQAAQDIGIVDPERVNNAVLLQSFDAPSSIISVDRATRHTWKRVRIGKTEPDGQFKELQASPYPLRPEPFPSYRSYAEWQQVVGEISEELK
ncbi:MAG: urea ABC transporter substrate-binding protein [Methylobacter sp.]|nr:urea ABC transporter substrate-binding protein [Methylobacter sp.]